jgi:hypothetical protein
MMCFTDFSGTSVEHFEGMRWDKLNALRSTFLRKSQEVDEMKNEFEMNRKQLVETENKNTELNQKVQSLKSQ